MKNTRPVNLDLFSLRFPVTAISSILHRLSGVLVFLLFSFFLCTLQLSLSSPEGFEKVTQYCQMPLSKCIAWVLLSALLYHVIAGIRHVIMDFGWGESRQSGRLGAYAVLIISFVLIVLLGYWLW